MRLKTIAGWNQTEHDWRRFLNLDPLGTFAACVDGEVVATGSTIIHQGRVAWIGMILVDPERRRQGIGTRMLHHCIDYLRARNVPSIKLDATPMGQPVYEKIGFLGEYGAARWEGSKVQTPSLPADTPRVTALSADDADMVRALDSPVFGCDRTSLLMQIREAAPGCAACVRHGSVLSGTVLARIGTDAHHVGPLVAEDPAVARALLAWAIERAVRPRVFIDILSGNEYMREMLTGIGMQQQRPFLRMYLGCNDWAGRPEHVYAIAGPELG